MVSYRVVVNETLLVEKTVYVAADNETEAVRKVMARDWVAEEDEVFTAIGDPVVVGTPKEVV